MMALKRRYTSTSLHDSTSQSSVIFVLVVMRSHNHVSLRGTQPSAVVTETVLQPLYTGGPGPQSPLGRGLGQPPSPSGRWRQEKSNPGRPLPRPDNFIHAPSVVTAQMFVRNELSKHERDKLGVTCMSCVANIMSLTRIGSSVRNTRTWGDRRRHVQWWEPTNLMQEIYSWEADSHTVSRRIPRCIHKRSYWAVG
jgi:hypothetical protein